MSVGEVIGYVVSIAQAFKLDGIIMAGFVMMVSVLGLSMLVRSLRGGG